MRVDNTEIKKKREEEEKRLKKFDRQEIRRAYDRQQLSKIKLF
jgi:hypothetical protein